MGLWWRMGCGIEGVGAGGLGGWVGGWWAGGVGGLGGGHRASGGNWMAECSMFRGYSAGVLAELWRCSPDILIVCKECSRIVCDALGWCI